MTNKLANYYKDLPQGFKEDYKIDGKKVSVSVLLNFVAGIISIAAILVCWILKYGFTFLHVEDGEIFKWMMSLILLIVSSVLYLIGHELTHGLFYKLLTKQKLKFGISLTMAFCGLKEGFVNKRTAIIAILAPFVIHSIWMIVAICLIPQMVWSWWLIVMFGLHFGGCSGDLYGAFILMFKYRGKEVLMSDSGPCQTFYTYYGEEPSAENAEEQSDGITTADKEN